MSVGINLSLGPVLGGYNPLMGSTFCLLGVFSRLLSINWRCFRIIIRMQEVYVYFGFHLLCHSCQAL